MSAATSLPPRIRKNSLLIVLATAAFAPSFSRAQSQEPVPRVALTVQRVSWGTHEDIRGGLLTREFVRQAVLIAARDELGLNTADAVLGESLADPAVPAALQLEITVATPQPNQLSVRLDVVGREPRIPLVDRQYAYNQDGRHIYESLARILEAESRTTFVDALVAAGAVRREVERGAAEADLTRVDELLAEMNVVSQFVAVRQTHEQLRPAPQSPAALGAVTRGYAHLALLTQEHWDASPQVFAARAVLYAERHCVATSESPASLANRVYARALIGLHELALRGFARLRELPESGAAAPAWGPIIEAYCRFDGAALEAASQPPSPLAPLAAVLRARVAAGVGDERLLLEATGDAVARAPEAYGLFPPLEYRGSLTVVRRAAVGSLQRLGNGLLDRFAATPEVPAAANALAANAVIPAGTDLEALFPPVLRELADVLANAASADAGDPSWQALAALVREEIFVQSAWFLEVTTGGVAMSMADEARAARPLIAGHRYEPYIASFQFDRDRQWDQFRAAIEPIDLVDLRPTMRRLYQRYWAVSFPNRELMGQNAFGAAIRQRSFTADEMAAVIRQADTVRQHDVEVQQQWDLLFHQLGKISPHHPLAVRQTIALTGQPTPEQLAAWEAAAQSDPRTLAALGAKYGQLGQPAAAIRCLERSIAVSPALAAFEALAAMHRAQGRDDLWQASLERYLEVEDYGLGHAQVQNKIAEDLLRRGRFAEAEPLARAAAATGAAWAMATASEVCERLEQWEDSEGYISTVSRNYAAANRAKWYFWCRRTGRGDEAAALELARQYLDSDRSKQDFYGPDSLLVYELLNNRPAQALEQAHVSWQRNNQSYWSLIHAALAAAESGNQPLADEHLATLQQITGLDDPNKNRPDRAALEFISEGLGADAGPPRTVEQLNDCLDPLDPPLRGHLAYFVGRTCELRGDVDGAAHCYRRGIAENSLQLLNVTLAAARLRAIEVPAP
jgi:tetratricopeptide (TPR) repeat protein